MLEQAKGDLEALLEELVVDASQPDQALSITLFHRNRLLPLLEISHRYRFGQVSVAQLLALTVKLRQASALRREQLLVGALLLGSLVSDRGADELDQFGSQSSRLPVPDDVFFDPLGWQVGHITVGALLVPAEAEEVGVDTPRASGVAEPQAALTAGAEQRALQVLLMFPGAIASQPTAGEHILDSLPGSRIDERFMLPVVLHAAVRQPAHVVRAAQDSMHLAPDQRQGCPGRRRSRLESSASKLVNNIRDRPLPSGIGLEGPGDMGRPLWIGHYVLDLTAIDLLGAVQIAKRGIAGCAAALGFLMQTLLCFMREILGVKLGDRRHDAVQQSAGRRIVDLLRN